MSLSTEEDTCVRVLLNYSASRGVGGGGKTSPNVEGGFPAEEKFPSPFLEGGCRGRRASGEYVAPDH